MGVAVTKPSIVTVRMGAVAVLAVLSQLAAFSCWLVVVLSIGFVFLSKMSAVNTTRSWARLSPLPVPLWRVEIESEGNMFSRGFIMEFEAPAHEVSEWLSTSPGTESCSWKENDGVRRCNIAPGEGANMAEISVLNEGTSVWVYASWS
jgi:hypothetical protein